MIVWDPDGEGPAEQRLVIGGNFRSSGPVTLNYIAWWDGAGWQPIGPGFNRTVQDVIAWDADGDGPQPPQLIAAGNFTDSGGAPMNRIARWDGSAWQPLGSGLAGGPVGIAYALASWDPDGAGPETPHLYATGDFMTAGGVTVNRIARWDGSTWHALEGGIAPGSTSLSTAGWALTVWPNQARGASDLIVGGWFSYADIVNADGVARWDGSAWHTLSTGVDTYTIGLTTFDADGNGPMTPRVIAVGEIDSAGGHGAGGIAAWADSDTPVIIEQPLAATSCAGGTATFTVAAGASDATYLWWAERVPGGGDYRVLQDGPTPTGSLISGAATATLTIANVSQADALLYRVKVAESCRESGSLPVQLTVCAADLNCDGVIDFADYLEFLNLYDALDPRVDLNHDGVIDFGDYLEFLNHYDSGC